MKYFTLDELKCKCGNCESTGSEMDNHFMAAIETLRIKCNFPFIVTSAYRCPDHNTMISKGKTRGAHTLGRAIDISVQGIDAVKFLNLAVGERFFTGIGINQRGSHRFIHLDNVKDDKEIPRPALWSY